MAKKYWQTEMFRALQSEWELVLKKAGFVDAEKLISGTLVLRQRASNAYRQASLLERQQKQKYYELLGAGFHAEWFEDTVEALVMERRSQGVSIKNICIELKAHGGRCHRETVRSIIAKYEAKWRVRRLTK
jgi:hypothetical protein